MSMITRRFTAPTVFLSLSLLLPALAAGQTRGALHDGMRRLWTEHAAWTRMFIMSTAAGLPDKDATTIRLNQNQTDIGNTIAQYFGQEAGAKLAALLKMHVVMAGDIIVATKANKASKVDSLSKQWHANADEVSELLHKLNPTHWSVVSMRTAMYAHLDDALAEATHYLTKDFTADIADYDAMEKHALMLSDMLSDGIVAQFPAKFAGAAKPARP